MFSTVVYQISTKHQIDVAVYSGHDGPEMHVLKEGQVVRIFEGWFMDRRAHSWAKRLARRTEKALVN